MKGKRNMLITLLLALTMIFGTAAFAVFADSGQMTGKDSEASNINEDDPYYVINGVKRSAVESDSGQGWSYEPVEEGKSGTLTLTGFSPEEPANAEIWFTGFDLTVETAGSEASSVYCVSLDYLGTDNECFGSLTLGGNGTLNITGYNSYNEPVSADNVTIKSGTVNCNGQQYDGSYYPFASIDAVYNGDRPDVTGKVSVEGGTVNLIGASYGIIADAVSVSGGNLTVSSNWGGIGSYNYGGGTGGAPDCRNVNISGGNISIDSSEAIRAESISISGGDIKIIPSKFVCCSGICGINVSISGGRTYIEALYSGIYAEEDLIISGSNTYVESKKNTIAEPEQRPQDDEDKMIAISSNSGITIKEPLEIIKPENGKIVKRADDEDLPLYTVREADGKNIAEHVIIKAKEQPEPTPAPEPTPEKSASGILLATMKAKGKTALSLSWTKMTNVDGYDVFISLCNTETKKHTPKLKKTVSADTNSCKISKLRKNTCYKAYVRAYVIKDGRKTYVKKSPVVHAFTCKYRGRFTNPKSVSVRKKSVKLSKGKSTKIKAKVSKLKKDKSLISTAHTNKVRYISSNKKIAAVSKSGKIKGVSAGKCKVYVYAANGVRKAVKVTVK